MIRSAGPRKTSSGKARARTSAKGRTQPVVLTIAGSDCSGGAGLQADLKTFAALGVYGASAVTCVVAEHPGRLVRITPLPPARVAEQIATVLEAFPVAAIKIGMLGSRAIIAAVEKVIGPALDAGVPLVIDPVLAASAGGRLLARDARPALLRLIARATLVTPNRAETAWLVGRPIPNERALRTAALELAINFAGPHVLAKGGHLRGREAVDWLASPSGTVARISARRIQGADPHGTGCTYASAIAAYLALGLLLPATVLAAKQFITQALQRRVRIGRYEMLNPDRAA
jgi:hydroxymethylpyrimidine/phosphomethylpyrimidine kinase